MRRWVSWRSRTAVAVVIVLCLQVCAGLGDEGRALMKFREGVEFDPVDAFSNWDANARYSCFRSGVKCSSDESGATLKLQDLGLEGKLSPQIGKLNGLSILSGRYVTSRRLLARGRRHHSHSENSEPTPSEHHGSIVPAPAPSPSGVPKLPPVMPSSVLPPVLLPPVPVVSSQSPSSAVPDSVQPLSVPVQSSESPSLAVPQSGLDSEHDNSWIIYASVGGSVVFLIALLAAIWFLYRRHRNARVVAPWVGELGVPWRAPKAGLPCFKRAELQQACEDFSNIINTTSNYVLYKGTLPDGVEIAVASSLTKSASNWPRASEKEFRNNVKVLSKVNHKNFMNLLGYCVEDGPSFARMMAFEYAPNGTLFENLHVKEAEHLDWRKRLRIAMGVMYCLDYIHQLKPRVQLKTLSSSSVCLDEDYAAKISYIRFQNEEREDAADADDSAPETVVYKYGLLLLEIISGRLPFSKDDGLLVLWATSYLTGKRPLAEMVDPTLQSVKEEELATLYKQVADLCSVIQQCVNEDARERPSPAEVAAQMRAITGISPESAAPRRGLSALWAEFEILSS